MYRLHPDPVVIVSQGCSLESYSVSLFTLSVFSFILYRKKVSEAEVTSEDREHAKRIVYSVVYGAGEDKRC